MDNLIFSTHLAEILSKSKIVYIKTNLEVLDFTTNAEFKIFLFGAGKKIEISVNTSNIHSIFGILSVSLFEEGVSLLGWNLKPLFSYFYFHLKNFHTPHCSILDLKVVEGFNGVRKQKAPESLAEAVSRYKALGDTSWLFIYKRIHLPLITKVIPYMETFPLVDKTNRCLRYACYEIEGQLNGRLQASGAFASSYNPHNISGGMLSCLKPSLFNYLFSYVDYKHQEVTVLAYLSKDEKLNELLRSGDDLYSRIYQIITGDECDTDEKRKKCKLLFLPIMYGLGGKSLASEFNIDLNEAYAIIGRVKEYFHQAWKWFDSYQRMAVEEGKAVDHVGRTRYFQEDAYLARNFALQAPSSVFCLEKLIELFNMSNDRFRLIYSVHDGYGLICDKKYIRDCIINLKKTLEGESTIFPGLSLKTKISFGLSLDQMKVLN